MDNDHADGLHWPYMASNLLVLDEFIYQTMSREEANLFFRVASYRYQKGSIAITTNKSIRAWPEVLASDEGFAGAILDRLLHSATVLNIQGRSYRLKDLETSVAQQASTTTRDASSDIPGELLAAFLETTTMQVNSAIQMCCDTYR